jgi:hypothetical protein
MPDFVTCPRCGFRIQALLVSQGQRLRCVSCGHGFEVGAAPEPPPVERLPPLEAAPPLEALPADEPPHPASLPPPLPRREAEPAWPDAERLPPRRFQLPIPIRPLLDEDEDGLPFCPGCGRRVRWEAYVCPYCEEEFEDDRELRRQVRRHSGQLKRDTEPHRGTTIVNLGNASMTLGIFSLCGGVTALAGLPLGIIGWVMANGDLEAMRRGALDQRGRKQTEAGRLNAITGVILGAVFATIWVLVWLYLH